MENISFMKTVKVTQKTRPVINIPKKIAENIDLDNTYITLILREDGSLDAKVTDSNGNVKIQKYNPYQEKIIQSQNNLYAAQLETKQLINNKLNELSDQISKIEINNSDKTTHDYYIEEPEIEQERKKSELIKIKEKNIDNYKYIFRYMWQDIEQYHNIHNIIEDGENLKSDSPTFIHGLNYVSGIGGYPSIKLDKPCDWECRYKGEEIIPELIYFQPHLKTYIKNEDGTEVRVSYDEIKPFENLAIFELVSFDGNIYRLDSDERWFDSYEAYFGLKTTEEILSKELHQAFLDKKIDKYLDLTDEYERNVA